MTFFNKESKTYFSSDAKRIDYKYVQKDTVIALDIFQTSVTFNKVANVVHGNQ